MDSCEVVTTDHENFLNFFSIFYCGGAGCDYLCTRFTKKGGERRPKNVRESEKIGEKTGDGSGRARQFSQRSDQKGRAKSSLSE